MTDAIWMWQKPGTVLVLDAPIVVEEAGRTLSGVVVDLTAEGRVRVEFVDHDPA